MPDYRKIHGNVPAGFDVHHLCGNHDCANWAHLIAVSPMDHSKIHRTLYSCDPQEEEARVAKNDVIQIRCNSIEKEKWQAAAKAAHMELSPWIRYHLDKAASQVVVTTTAELFPDPSEGRTWEHDRD